MANKNTIRVVIYSIIALITILILYNTFHEPKKVPNIIVHQVSYPEICSRTANRIKEDLDEKPFKFQAEPETISQAIETLENEMIDRSVFLLRSCVCFSEGYNKYYISVYFIDESHLIKRACFRPFSDGRLLDVIAPDTIKLAKTLGWPYSGCNLQFVCEDSEVEYNDEILRLVLDKQACDDLVNGRGEIVLLDQDNNEITALDVVLDTVDKIQVNN